MLVFIKDRYIRLEARELSYTRFKERRKLEKKHIKIKNIILSVQNQDMIVVESHKKLELETRINTGYTLLSKTLRGS